ncbi:hypothetical protein CVT24_010032 [Panaeolus cyanescens]|uniref:SEC7 domain-containing protein n=1 Tax=Panaeolus cyanescens TaxID=181874 RepID=A0A409W401_9AGAR|nr:hypothetical protein CVT24_010032 [Panaeolus cyanescens]
MDNIIFPCKISDNDHDNTRPTTANDESPPSYHQATTTTSPLLLQETTTTTTEVVTTTTTQTVTHLFPFPPWRKRNLSQTPNPNHHSHSGLLTEKALPPTPFRDSSDNDFYTLRTAPVTRSETIGVSFSKSSPSTVNTPTTQYPSLGIGHPTVSPSCSYSTTLTASNPFKSRPSTSAGERSVAHSSETFTSQNHILYAPEYSGSERQRGLSFGSLVKKGKAPEEPRDHSGHEPKRLVRKTSLWSRRKASQPTELASSPPLSPRSRSTEQPDNVIALPPLPLVHQTSPFEVELFSEKNINSKPPQRRRTSQSSPETPHPSQPPGDDNPHLGRPQHNGVRTDDEKPQSHKLRPQTSTPLLHRLSMAVFAIGSSETPSPVAKSNLITESPAQSTVSSPIPTAPSPRIPRPSNQDGESPDVYVTRLRVSVNKAEIASILAANSDAYHTQALRSYFNHFDFCNIPLDVALRKLLMEVSLPRETQQIDRVIEAFSLRYTQCNPELFTSDDHPHILAFSLIMLHTDAFNPSNKRKMTKADYVKNTKQPGIVTEVLDCFFDNIVFAPFIFIEDPVDYDGQIGANTNITTSPSTMPASAFPPSTGTSTFKMTNKIDPYYLIVNNLLDALRVDVESCLPLSNPFSFRGINPTWVEEELHCSFVHASAIRLGFRVVNGVTVVTSNLTHPTNPVLPTSDTQSETRYLKVAKMGLLNRKDDLLEGGRRSHNRKWRMWGVMLTGSQLLFFRDSSVIVQLVQVLKSSEESVPSLLTRPDEIFSLKDAIAAHDRSYTKYAHSMRFAVMDGRQLLLQASDDQQLDEWISRINYASAFRTAGIRMRPPGLSGEDIHLTGVAAATSHLHDIQQTSNLSRPHSWGSDAPSDLMDMLSGQSLPRPSRSATLASYVSEYDIPVAPEIEGAEQFKATFDQVKADLMADDDAPPDVHLDQSTSTSIPLSPQAPTSSVLLRQRSIRKSSSRAHIIQTKIQDLRNKMEAMEPQLKAHRLFIRNISILTPFQKTTRLRLAAAIHGMARQITQTRLDMERLKCHLFVLQSDLAAETLAWEESKDVALRIAKETLRSRRSLPLMTISPDEQRVELTTSPTESTLSSSLNTPLCRNRTSSSCGSYHSATDFGFDWSSAEDLFLSSNQHDASTSNRPHTPAPRPSMVSSSSARSSSERQKVSSQEADEEAEEWHRTRCAQRVSLVHVPSTFKITSWLKHDSPFPD